MNHKIISGITSNLSADSYLPNDQLLDLTPAAYQQVQDYLGTETATVDPEFISQQQLSQQLLAAVDDFKKFKQEADTNRPQQGLWSKARSHELFSYPAKAVDYSSEAAFSVFLGSTLNMFSKNVMGLCQQFYYQKSPSRLFIVGENIQRMAGILEIDEQKMTTWILVHEMTHIIQMNYSEVVFNFFNRSLRELFVERDIDKKKLLTQVKATMTYIEGMADHVMDHPGLLSEQEIAEMREKVDYRRNNLPIQIQLVMRLLGNKHQQYIQGKQFADYIVKRCGTEALMLPLTAEKHFPQLTDISNPQDWVKRNKQYL